MCIVNFATLMARRNKSTTRGRPRAGDPARIFFDLAIFFKKHFFQNFVRAGRRAGWMAERSKALVSGTSLFGGVGSNPIPISTILVWDLFATRDVQFWQNFAAPGEDRTRDLRIMRPTRCQLRHRSLNTPTVGLEPTTTRLRVLRSTN